MTATKREILIGIACVAASGAAAALRPHRSISLLGKAKLDQLVPLNFSGWHGKASDGLVQADDEDSLSAKLYSQTVGRIYEDASGASIMMLVAYGGTQNDVLQLHRPEVCYPAFGMEVVANRPAEIPVAKGLIIPARALIATGANRTEHILYWTRIGERFPANGSQQRLAKFKDQLAGIIPDGVLVRISTLEPDDGRAMALSKRFVHDMLHACSIKARQVLLGMNTASILDAGA